MSRLSHAQLQEKIAQRFQPVCLRYWDRQFIRLNFWPHWVQLKHTVHKYLPLIRAKAHCSHREAMVFAWRTYLDVTNGDEENPFVDDYLRLVRAIDPAELPLYLCHTSIGSDMLDGHSETEAHQLYLDWLAEDGDNPIFDDWALTLDLRVIPTEEFLRRNQS